MPKIFISYRRTDSHTFTDRIHDRLEEVFGTENVFQDVDSIPAGNDFRLELQSAIDLCDVVLVVIGKQWAIVTDPQGRKRLFNAADYVRIEVETALNSDKLVIPILIDGASPIAPDDLPDTLHDLAYRNAVTVRHNPDFKRDMERLIKRIQDYTEEKSNQPKGILHKISGNFDKARGSETWSIVKIPDLSFLTSEVLKILPPPFEWCFIPSGNVTLETNPAKTYTISDFAIAKYTITNAQFQVFIEARDGYMYEDHYRWYDFSRDARDYRSRNPKPKTTAFKGDDFPRTNLVWFDAVAFCRWLNNHIGQHVSLSTEQQWQRAAQGDTNWTYPWGNQFQTRRCNTIETGLGQPIVFDSFSEGISPYGVFNMSGNIWEWCLNNIQNSDDIHIDSDVRFRVLRGGSWNGDQNQARAAYRHNSIPDYVGNDIGFRCVVSVPNS